MPSTLKEHLHALKSAYSNDGMPCSVGTIAVKPSDLILYYGKPGPNDSPRLLNFSDVSEDDLRMLADYCEPASFGRGAEAVHDKTYRKAGKLDVNRFATNFGPEPSGLLDQIRYLLLEGKCETIGIRSELYKLNIYGPGSFFKTHKDTPRGDNMFASLVVVFPTVHKGGALLFEHNDRSFRFDSSQALSEVTSPSVAYAAFFSDVDHEVELVQSGYRVTLTYNLYYTFSSATPNLQSIKTSFEDRLKESFQALLDDPTVLREGGAIGFCLRHEYTPDVIDKKKLLKGSDAVLAKVCDDLGLKSYARMLYEDHGDSYLLDCRAGMPDFLDIWDEDIPFSKWILDGGGIAIDGDEPDLAVYWATERQASNISPFEDRFPSYGNEPALDTYYSSLCFIIEIPGGRHAEGGGNSEREQDGEATIAGEDFGNSD